MNVSSLPKAGIWKMTGRDLNMQPFGSLANSLPLCHTGHTFYSNQSHICHCIDTAAVL